MFNVPFGPPDKGGRAELSNANVHGTFFPPHTGPIGMGAKEGGRHPGRRGTDFVTKSKKIDSPDGSSAGQQLHRGYGVEATGRGKGGGVTGSRWNVWWNRDRQKFGKNK